MFVCYDRWWLLSEMYQGLDTFLLFWSKRRHLLMKRLLCNRPNSLVCSQDLNDDGVEALMEGVWVVIKWSSGL